MPKPRIPAFPLPVVIAPLAQHNPNWVDPGQNARDRFKDYYTYVDEEVQVLTVNFQAGTMRVRTQERGTDDIPAAAFFEQYRVIKK